MGEPRIDVPAILERMEQAGVIAWLKDDHLYIAGKPTAVDRWAQFCKCHEPEIRVAMQRADRVASEAIKRMTGA